MVVHREPGFAGRAPCAAVRGGARARLLTALLWAAIVLCFVPLAWFAYQGGTFGERAGIGALAIALLALAYGMVRRGRSGAAIGLAIATAAAAPLALFALDRDAGAAPAYLTIPLILAATLLRPWAASLAVALIAVAGVGGLVLLDGGRLAPPFVTTAALALVAAALLLAGIRHRTEVEGQRNAALRESAANFQALAESAQDGIVVAQNERIVFINPQAARLLDYEPEHLIGRAAEELLWPEDRDWVLARHRRRMAGDDVPTPYELRVIARGGTPRLVEIDVARTTWKGRPAGLITVRDMEARLRAEAHMRKLSGALEQTADAVVITDRAGIIEYVNPAYEQITGYSREEAVGQRPSIVKSGEQGERFYQRLWDTITRGDVFSDVFINRRKDGTLYYEEKTITPLSGNGGEITHFIATGRDITERVHTQERLEFMAHHDSLTALPNRVLFLDRLEQALARARWHDRLVAVIFLDLDRFKQINDSLGHDAGDALLRELSARLHASLRERDTIARLGGDEFGILLDDVASEDDVADLAEKVLANLREPFALEGRDLFVTASIGISLYPADGEQAGTLLKHADTAMYKAKEAGKNTFQFYSAEMSVRAFERLTVETSLRHALERQEWRLYFQPLVEVRSGRIAGVEALLRWQHPDLGLLPPGDFIPVLEDTGLICAVGEWVLRAACRQAREFQRLLPDPPWMTVNVSSRQLAGGPSFVDALREALDETGLAPDQLELEITESMLMVDTEHTARTLRAVDDLGVRLAIDDFGTGYSSLAYLKRFPIDTLKIDRTFVRDIPVDADDTAIVRSVIALGRSLHLGVIAEGVESEEQLRTLQDEGCELVQGFLLGPPMPAADLATVLAGRGAPPSRGSA